jgi:hypothetical protein
VLNALTEHDFQDSFKKNGRNTGIVHTHGRLMVDSRPKLVSDQMAASVLEIMDSSGRWAPNK